MVNFILRRVVRLRLYKIVIKVLKDVDLVEVDANNRVVKILKKGEKIRVLTYILVYAKLYIDI